MLTIRNALPAKLGWRFSHTLLPPSTTDILVRHFLFPFLVLGFLLAGLMVEEVEGKIIKDSGEVGEYEIFLSSQTLLVGSQIDPLFENNLASFTRALK